MQERITHYWDHRAGSFSEYVREELQGKKDQGWIELLDRYCGKSSGKKVLDVGCGPGFFSILLSRVGYEVTALDVSGEMLSEAAKNAEAAGCPAIRFLQGNAHVIRKKDEAFDLIVSRNVTWLLEKPLEAYREWYRLLSPGGKVMIFDANWYLRLGDDELQRCYEKYRDQALTEGHQERVSREKQQESEDIARELPMTYVRRPDWDREALCRCGFGRVDVEENINSRVFTGPEKTLYHPTPMFAICAHK